jgi:hypothetical protein
MLDSFVHQSTRLERREPSYCGRGHIAMRAAVVWRHKRRLPGLGSWGLGCQACFFVHRPASLSPASSQSRDCFAATPKITMKPTAFASGRSSATKALMLAVGEALGFQRGAFAARLCQPRPASRTPKRAPPPTPGGFHSDYTIPGLGAAGHISALPQPAWPPSPRSFACCPHGGRHLSRWRISSPLTTYQGSTAEPAPTQLSFSLCLK